MAHDTSRPAGFSDEPAPSLGVTQWLDPSGKPMVDYDLDKMPGAYKLIFCFQDACPGCHLTGFPSLARVVDAFRGSSFVSFAVVQTVFEDFRSNTYERMVAAQARYALPIPFGHDAGGEGREGAGSVLMQRYRNGGTPWFMLFDPAGDVIYRNFRIDADQLIASLKRAEAAHGALQPDPNLPA